MKTKQEIKETGATFTPRRLADYLASEIIENLTGTEFKILDPACGDGALLESFAQSINPEETQVELFGYDADESYLSEAEEKLHAVNIPYQLLHEDFLELINHVDPGSLFGKEHEEFDAIIANPPYVRTQVLGAERAQKIAEKFNLKGRVDLYYPFLIGMTQKLITGGILGVITSNRYLSTKSGESIRKFLCENYDIIKVIDLGDTKLFDAAVLPAIFIGRKKNHQNVPSEQAGFFIKIYEELNVNEATNEANDLFEVISARNTGCYSVGNRKYNLSNGVLRYTVGSKEHWQMLTEEENVWINTVEANSIGKIKNWFKVRVGIKTTADKIFIKKDWNSLGDEKPESELLRTLISQDNIDKWALTEKERLEVLYTHYDNNGRKAVINLKDFPKAESYLNSHREKLEERKYVIKAKRAWFEIWVPQNPVAWKLPKLVFPDISDTPRFYFDISGNIVNGNCYWIAATNEREARLLRLIQGVANSDVMRRYHELRFNNKLYSGKFRYFTQYVENYPIPDPELEASNEIIQLVTDLSSSGNNVCSWKEDLNELVMSAFGLTGPV